MATITTKSLSKLNKGDLFTVISFTGLQFGTYRVTAVSKTKFKALNRKSEEMIFNRADGTQVVEEGREKWANRAVDLFPESERKPLVEPETEEEHKARRKARRAARKAAAAAAADKAAASAPKSEKKVTKGAAPVTPADKKPEADEFEEDEEDTTPPPAKKDKKADKKAASAATDKKSSKKAAPAPEPEETDEDEADDEAEWEDA